MLRAVDFSHVHEHVSCVILVCCKAFDDQLLTEDEGFVVCHASRSLILASCLSDSGNTASRLLTSCLKYLPSISTRHFLQRSAVIGRRGTDSRSSSQTSSL